VSRAEKPGSRRHACSDDTVRKNSIQASRAALTTGLVAVAIAVPVVMSSSSSPSVLPRDKVTGKRHARDAMASDSSSGLLVAVISVRRHTETCWTVRYLPVPGSYSRRSCVSMPFESRLCSFFIFVVLALSERLTVRFLYLGRPQSGQVSSAATKCSTGQGRCCTKSELGVMLAVLTRR
jgi:hypothetical protein